MIKKINDMDIPPTHIIQISAGHKNVQSINIYSHVSQQKQRNMSLILSSNSTCTEAAAKAPRTSVAIESEAETLSFTKTPAMPGTGPFSGAVFHGGHFNITINTVNQSPTSVSTARGFTSDDDDSPPT